MNSVITVEVVYCASHQQFFKKLPVVAGSTIRDVINLAEIKKYFMEIDFSAPTLKVGVFSKVKPIDYQVKDGDRVEIYRSLHQTPRQARTMRADKQKKK